MQFSLPYGSDFNVGNALLWAEIAKGLFQQNPPLAAYHRVRPGSGCPVWQLRLPRLVDNDRKALLGAGGHNVKRRSSCRLQRHSLLDEVFYVLGRCNQYTLKGGTFYAFEILERKQLLT